MARIPKYGRRMRPAGPDVYHISQPVYDRGLAAWEQAAGQVFGELEEVRRAQESSEIVGRSAQFSLDLQNLLTETSTLQINGQPASPEQQIEHYKSKSAEIEQRLMDMPGASREAQTRLSNVFTAEMAQQLGNLQQMQRQRRLKDIADKSLLAINTATTTGSRPLLEQTLNEMVATGITTPAAAEEQRRTFDTDVAIGRLDRGIWGNPEGVLTQARELLGKETTTETQRAKLEHIHGLAHAAANERKQKEDELSDSIINDALSKAWSMDLKTFQSQLQQTPGITEIQKRKLERIFIDAEQDRQKAGKSPFVLTQNQPLLAQAIIDMERGRIKTRTQLTEDYWLKDGTVNFSIDDKLMLNRLLDSQVTPTGESKYSLNHPIAKLYFQKLEERVFSDVDTQELRKGMTLEDYTRRWYMLDAAFRSEDPKGKVWGDAAKMKETYDGLWKEEDEKQARGWLARFAELELQTEGAYVIPQLFVPGRRFTAVQPPETPKKPVEWPRIRADRMVPSHEEGQKLPKGTRYGIPGDPHTYESGLLYEEAGVQ